MITLGLIVNPIAGMGGSVGLKGTDGDAVARARELGARPVAPDRARAFLVELDARAGIRWLVAPGPMGVSLVSDHLASLTVVGALTSVAATSSEDTRRIARAMADAGADLLVFVGGDGTARDILDAVGTDLPVVGVPAGVKVYSSAFALSPRAAAEMVGTFCEMQGLAGGKELHLTEGEVLDIDEDAFRDDRLEVRHYGYVLVPAVQSLRQPGKTPSQLGPDTLEAKRDMAASFVERMDPDALILLGPGTTVAAIAEALDLPKTLLGIDAVLAGKLLASDLSERGILDLLTLHADSCIVVTPLGGNGFIFGRGNKPFTPEVIRKVGRDHIVVVATEQKVRQIGVLRVDTGDPALDTDLSGYIEVQTGYNLARAVKVVAV